MSDRIRLVIILAEDERSAAFLRRYIERAIDFQRRRVLIAPKGKGSAYDWVIQRFAEEVKEQRRCVSAKNKNQALLVVHIDADNLTVADRMNQLTNALVKAEIEPRDPDERIAICVAKRNIETWIHGLTDVAVDETYDFKRDEKSRIATSQRERNELCGQRVDRAAEQLFQLTRNNAPPPPASMPSVTTAVQELRRLDR